MPEVIINGPEGRIEARYHHGRGPTRGWRWCCTRIRSMAGP